MAVTAKILVVGGGGGGGAIYHGAGGGGGGVIQNQALSMEFGHYVIKVGEGGPSIAQDAITTGAVGNNGGDSRIGSIAIANGGGGGGSYSLSGSPSSTGRNGGSGGGGAGSTGGNLAGSGTNGQGFAGGAGVSASPRATGGGGGAGAVGAAGSGSTAGVGGVGIQSSIPGTTLFYGGGGGGSTYSTGTPGAGGQGGGGAGRIGLGVNGTVNTGGGGGGSERDAGNTVSSAGGSGIVVVSVPTASASVYAENGSITVSGLDTIATFLSGFGLLSILAPGSSAPETVTSKLLVVAGGGGGGGPLYGGGGGGGGVMSLTGLKLPCMNYDVVVGNGGAGGVFASLSIGGTRGSPGGASSFGTFSSPGGGGGGSYHTTVGSGSPAGDGGSGGGGAGSSRGNVFGYGSTGAGNRGGTGSTAGANYGAAGGAGAGGVGGNGTGTTGGSGGPGLATTIHGSTEYYGGGGGGSTYSAGTPGAGGQGGGGAGSTGLGAYGTVNTGGGGGGSERSGSPANGTTGGSGIVVLSIPTGAGGLQVTNGTSSVGSGNIVATFIHNGSVTITGALDQLISDLPLFGLQMGVGDRLTLDATTMAFQADTGGEFAATLPTLSLMIGDRLNADIPALQMNGYLEVENSMAARIEALTMSAVFTVGLTPEPCWFASNLTGMSMAGTMSVSQVGDLAMSTGELYLAMAGGGEIDSELPMLTMVGDLASGSEISMTASTPELSFSGGMITPANGEFAAVVDGLSLRMVHSNVTPSEGDLIARLDRITMSASAASVESGAFVASLPAFGFASASGNGVSADLTIKVPALSFTAKGRQES